MVPNSSMKQDAATGTDMSGQKVSTGVYLIFAADQEGTYKCKTKMLVVR